jgi:hypothetical protein
MLSFIYAERPKCCVTNKSFILSVVMLSVVLLSVIALVRICCAAYLIYKGESVCVCVCVCVCPV